MKLILDIGGAEEVTFGPEDEIRGTLNILGHGGQALSHLRATFGGKMKPYSQLAISVINSG